MKNKFFGKITKLMLAVLAVVLVSAALPFQSFAAPEKIMVAFDPQDGSPYEKWEKIYVNPGEKIPSMPTTPQYEGHVFLGWFYALDKDGNPILWDFESDKVESGNITLWAAWQEGYLVAFDPDFGGAAYDDFQVIIVDVGAKITQEIKIPQREGYVFNGWFSYLDENYNPVFWKFQEDRVNQNITLWADWKEACTVTFDPRDGLTKPEDFEKITVGKGDLMTSEVKNPVREGFDFKGWAYTLDNKRPVLWDFLSNTVERDMTFWAVWEEKNEPENPGQSGINGEKEKPGKEEPDNKNPNPKTGDTAGGIVLIFVLSAFAVSYGLIFRKKVK